MSTGYASGFINEVNASDKSKIGVRLGLTCIRADIPVSDISEFFDVSRVTVYSWFRGKSNVPEKHQVKMQKLIEKLRQLCGGLGLADRKGYIAVIPLPILFIDG